MWSSCGYRAIQVSDETQKATLPVAFLDPALAEERRENFGPHSIAVAKGANVAASTLPLILISHGNGGTPWAYRDLAKHLARSGYVVALPEHIGNSRSENSLEKTAANLENRLATFR